MYAIVDIAGQQFKVEKDQKVVVNRLNAEEGSSVELDRVLLVSNKGKVDVGVPTVDGVRVAAKVLSHERGDKVLVFHKKRRKGYQKLNGHRQALTILYIEGILGKGEKGSGKAVSKADPKAKKAAKAAAPVKEAPKATPKAAPKAAAPAPKAAAKKAPAKASSKGDDLRKVEGIGPKIAELLNAAGINSFADLAATDADKIRAILEEAGSRYKMHDPTTWPQQAKLAADGKWDDLKELQDNLKGGK